MLKPAHAKNAAGEEVQRNLPELGEALAEVYHNLTSAQHRFGASKHETVDEGVLRAGSLLGSIRCTAYLTDISLRHSSGKCSASSTRFRTAPQGSVLVMGSWPLNLAPRPNDEAH